MNSLLMKVSVTWLVLLIFPMAKCLTSSEKEWAPWVNYRNVNPQNHIFLRLDDALKVFVESFYAELADFYAEWVNDSWSIRLCWREYRRFRAAKRNWEMPSDYIERPIPENISQFLLDELRKSLMFKPTLNPDGSFHKESIPTMKSNLIHFMCVNSRCRQFHENLINLHYPQMAEFD